jgi:ubiquinone/menaquinone biosynthesis C-methylase UbiE
LAELRISAEQQRISAEYDRRSANAGLSKRYGLFNPAQWAALAERERKLLTLLLRHGRATLWEQRILDVGCGNGYLLHRLMEMGAYPRRCIGIDLHADRLAQGRERARSPLLLADATSLPFPAANFDIVTQNTMLSSVLDPQLRGAIAAEMRRVLKPDGLIIWYDFARSNPRNPNVIGLNLSEVRRFFMSIPEAVRLVIQGGAYDDPSCIYMLDMGQPVRIADLAARMIRLRGYRLPAWY